MKLLNARPDSRIALLGPLVAAGLASAASAQSTFSIDWHSPTLSVPDTCGGVPITEADILTPAAGTPGLGPLAAPCIAIPGGVAGLNVFNHVGCVGHPAGTPCRIEVDALSYGKDHPMGTMTAQPGDYLFSTDEFAVGGVAPVLFPSLATESPFGDSATDVWFNGGALGLGPLAPFASPVGHTSALDGDGLASGSGAVYPGTGLLEPTFPGPPPNTGDNLDAYDYDKNMGSTGFPSTGVYYSMAGFLVDPLTGVASSASDLANGVDSADVLISAFPGSGPAVYAPAVLLGLGITGKDDLDALAVAENGAAGFQPSQAPYDWLGVGARDMVLFSVKRGSAVIGFPDSIFGIPICEGDILTTPLPTGMGGVSPFPGIFCAAENIGLATNRTPGGFSDDLDALDAVQLSGNDCNGNGIDDCIDILNGTSADADFDGVPDECGPIGTPGCLCDSTVAPCGNAFPAAGCRNSTGVGAFLAASGSVSVGADDLVLLASDMPSGVPAIFFGGTFPVGPLTFGDGLRCAGGNIVRFSSPALTSAIGELTAGPGLATAYGITSVDTWIFQCWFRDSTGPCGSGFNTSSSLTVSFAP